MDYYHSIEKLEEIEIKIKSSRFIAYTTPVSDRENANQVVQQIQKKHYKANHNCYAYLIGWDGNEFRFDDDGEPNSSAGKPILYVIKKFEISDVIVVVTRYFGGTKLGVGGLVRAYSEAAESVLNLTTKKIINRTEKILTNCRYEEINLIKRISNEYAVSITENYDERIQIFADVPISKVGEYIEKIFSQTNGNIKPERIVF